MAETSGYNYRVLCLLGAETAIGKAFADLGWHRARTPDAAMEKACEIMGLPVEDGGTVVAIAERQWNERQAAKRMVPVWDIKPIGDEAEPPADPEDRGLPPAAGEDLAEGIDPEHACEWTEDGATCEHLPGDHGERGLGMCRVKGCPCGGYQPRP